MLRRSSTNLLRQKPLPSASIAAEHGFKLQYKQKVFWNDIDVHQHVSNSQIIKYFEEARVQYLHEMGVAVTSKTDKTGPILAQIGAKFRAPIKYPSRLILAAKVEQKHLEDSKFTLTHAVFIPSKGHHHDEWALAAVGTGIIVPYCYQTLKRAPMPAEWVSEIERIEGY